MRTNLPRKLIAFLILAILLVLARPQVSAQTTSERLDELNRQINEYTAEITRLQSQAGTLAGEMAQFDARINLTELRIEQTQGQISLLGGRIDQLEVSLSDLSEAFDTRVSETYKLSRMDKTPLLLIASGDISEAVARFHYLQKIQELDRSLLSRLDTAKTSYEEQKGELEVLGETLETQKLQLDQQKAARANLLAATRNNERRFQQLLTDARAQLNALRRFVSAQGGASILSGQTKCDDWGCYYNQRDSEWGNIGLGGSNYSVAEYGCLISSVSMLASHYGRNIKPTDIAILPNAFVPNTGFLYHSFSVNGVSVSLASVSRDRLDSELAAGRPVIAGLYSGPDHFIVILRKDGDNYIMHDPFMPNGAARPLTDKYNVSDITSLRLVNFN